MYIEIKPEIDVSDPVNPKEISYQKTTGGGGPIAVAISGSFVYMTGHSDPYDPADLVIIDVSNPTTPSIAATFEIGDGADIVVEGDNAYVVQSTRLLIISIAALVRNCDNGEIVARAGFVPTTAVAKQKTFLCQST